jgi:hypothetical protein
VQEFEQRVADNGWAVYRRATRGCRFLGSPRRLDEPDDAILEFERDKLHTSMAGQLVVMNTVMSSVKPGDEEDDVLKRYDHRKGSFTVMLRHANHGRWPALGGMPKIRRDPLLSGMAPVFVRDAGGGKIKYREKFVPLYMFVGDAKFTFKVQRETAKQWTLDGVSIRFSVVQEFVELRYHKKCLRVCSHTKNDTIDCPPDPVNTGAGMYYVTKTVGHELYINDQLVSEKQPPELPGESGTASGGTAIGVVPKRPRRVNRAACLRQCVARCDNDPHCERSCAARSCRYSR